MEIRELMTKSPVACLPGDSCAAAGRLMREYACGFLPVVESRATQRVIGVVTDRDLALFLAGIDQPAGGVTVERCMTRTVYSVAPSTELEDAARVMEAAAVHRLPVLEHDRLVGVLSLKDLARAARKEWASSGPHAVERQMSEILEAIAEHRTE